MNRIEADYTLPETPLDSNKYYIKGAIYLTIPKDGYYEINGTRIKLQKGLVVTVDKNNVIEVQGGRG